MHIDAMLPAQIADALPHDGIGTRGDWLRAGASERMFADGRLRRVARGIYVAADDDRPLTAARLATLLPEDCAVGGWAAALAHGVRDAGPTMVRGEPVDLLAYPGRYMHKKLPGFRTLRSDFCEADVVRFGGVLMTTVLRTAYDMVRFAPDLLSAVAILDCFRCEFNPLPVAPAELRDMMEARPRGRGHARLRLALGLSSSRSRSIPESSLRTRMVTDLAVPLERIAANATLEHQGDHYELDLVDLTTGLVLEYDSLHHADAAQRGRDSRKNVAVDEVGLVMLRVNSPLLGSARELIRSIAARRQSALGRGCAARVAQLCAEGKLRQLPLRP